MRLAFARCAALLLTLVLGACGARTAPWVPCTFDATPTRLQVMLVVDRSGSMAINVFDHRTRYDFYRRMADTLRETVPALDEVADVGLIIFPDRVHASERTAPCAVASSADVAPSAESSRRIIAVLDGTEALTLLGAPAYDTINVAADILERRSVGSPFLVLAADGYLDCNASLNPRTCPCINLSGICSVATECYDTERVEQRVAALAHRGIPTLVLGMDLDTTDVTTSRHRDYLSRLARAGGLARGGTNPREFFDLRYPSDIRIAFESRLVRVAWCRRSVAYPRESLPVVDFVLRGRTVGAIPRDTTRTDGWDWIGSNAVEVFGASCDAVHGARDRLQLTSEGATCL